MLATPIYIASSINPALDKYVAYKNSELISKGWKNLNKYHWSALRDSYSKSEFPIYFKGLGQEKKGVPNGIFVYSNKTSIPMKISSDTPYKTKITDLTYYGSQVTVDPMSSIEVSIPLAPSRANDREKEVEFSIFWGDEYIFDQSLTINLDAL
ncbi:hypothetical protein LMG26858_02355 [Achromobacter anxifer]|uniref:Uncharacterized protein n=2 Tax=Achromobacter anxifer TaxID=1287737 RepID=A0A6S7DXY8_9BURK|nr:hypothetical protein LMG26858_02355 [Achromobacter anxifer]